MNELQKLLQELEEDKFKKSLPTFIRTQLKVRGKTEHNGRGAFEMQCNDALTFEQICSIVSDRLDRWRARDLIERVDEGEHEDGVKFMAVVFVKGVFKHGYRTFLTTSITERLGNNYLGAVVFSID